MFFQDTNRKKAIITGAAKRIGRDISLYLAQQGWDLVLHFNQSKAEIEELAQTLKQHCNIELFQADFLNFDEKSLLDEFKKISFGAKLLINNASIFENDDSTNFSLKTQYDHMLVNCFAPNLLSKAFIEANINFNDLNIININDYNIKNTAKDFFSYHISKCALMEATKHFAFKHAKTCRINSISLGYVLKPAKMSKEAYENFVKQTPLSTETSTKEICSAIELFLRSPSVTGANITLDSGLSLV